MRLPNFKTSVFKGEENRASSCPLCSSKESYYCTPALYQPDSSFRWSASLQMRTDESSVEVVSGSHETHISANHLLSVAYVHWMYINIWLTHISGLVLLKLESTKVLSFLCCKNQTLKNSFGRHSALHWDGGNHKFWLLWRRHFQEFTEMVCGHRFLQAHVQTESSKVNKLLISDITGIANFLPSRSGTFHK